MLEVPLVTEPTLVDVRVVLFSVLGLSGEMLLRPFFGATHSHAVSRVEEEWVVAVCIVIITAADVVDWTRHAAPLRGGAASIRWAAWVLRARGSSVSV